jgi:hypothetical protein
VPAPWLVVTVPGPDDAGLPAHVGALELGADGGVRGDRDAADDARRVEDDRGRADRRRAPAFAVEAPSEREDALVGGEVARSGHPAGKDEHRDRGEVDVVEGRVGGDGDAVGPLDGSGPEPRDRHVELRAAQDVDDRDGLDLLEALGQRNEDALS